jgi:hypothetical protein
VATPLPGEVRMELQHNRPTCRYQLSYPGILVVEAAEEGDRDDRADRLDRAADRGVFRKSEVDTGAVVVVGVGTEDLAKMGFAQDQDMVQAFSSDRADEPFGVTVLPGSGILQADAYGGYGKLRNVIDRQNEPPADFRQHDRQPGKICLDEPARAVIIL